MSDLRYISRYQNLHMDRANSNMMKTVQLNVTSNIPYRSTVMFHRYKHGYNYKPQFWGLWDLKLNSAFGGSSIRMYSHTAYMTGLAPSIYLSYEVDNEYVSLYLEHSDPRPGTPAALPTAGTTATFTGYVFANDEQPQDYTK